MTYVTHDESEFVPPMEVEEPELYHPKTFIGKYIWSQDAKVIAVQYSLTAIFVGLDRARAVRDHAAAARMAARVLVHHARHLPSVRDDARHDHGDLPAHRALPRWIRQLPDPADGGRARHGVPVRQHGELLGLPVRGAAARRELLRAGRAHGRRLDLVSAAGDPRRNAGRELGNHPDAGLARVLHHRVHDGRPELRGDGAAGAHARDDDDASAADGLGHLHGDDPRAARVPGAVRQRDHDDARPGAGDELLHAGARRQGRASRLQRRQPDPVPAPVLVLRASRGLHRRAAGVRHRLRSDQHQRAQEHLRLPDDGLGDPRDRRA